MRDSDIHSIANFLAGVRDELSPIIDGKIQRGKACFEKGDLSLEPGFRKTTLVDARKIAASVYPKLNRAIDALFDIHQNS